MSFAKTSSSCLNRTSAYLFFFRYTEFLSNEKLKSKMCLKYSAIDSNGIAEVRQNREHGLEFVWHTCLGKVGIMCGNGCRVFASFVKISGIHTGIDDVTFLAGDGHMHLGNYDPETREGWASLTDVPDSKVVRISENEFISTAEHLPHMVVFVDYDVETINDANEYGQRFEQEMEELDSKSILFDGEFCL